LASTWSDVAPVGTLESLGNGTTVDTLVRFEAYRPRLSSTHRLPEGKPEAAAQHEMRPFSEQHFRHYLRLVDDDPSDWQTIEEHLPDIRAAWEWATTQPGRDVQVLELVWALEPFLDQRTALDEQLRWYARALYSAEVLDLPEDKAWLHIHIGQIHRGQGDLDAALAAYDDAMALWTRLGEQVNVGVTLNNIGLVLEDRRELDAALSYFERALAIHRAFDNRSEQSTTLHNMANLYREMGELDRAQDTYATALALARAQDDRSGEAATLYQLCVLYYERDDLDAAVRGLNTVLEAVRELGDLRGEAMAESLLGDAFDGLDDWERAASAHERAGAIWRALGERGQQARARCAAW